SSKKPASAPPPEVKEVAPPPPPSGTGFSGVVQPTGVLDMPTTLDTGYVVPSKRRTTPNVKKLRKQLRPKLLAIPEEM
ncbi:MAG TPA: hypothetical protein PLZ51_23605, partial [Aggregatilineales bacterium]|nr:hypothetical protein [Aggregatilineales bacterium]